MKRFLGKKKARVDDRVLHLEHYLATDLPTPPAAVDWRDGMPNWQMLGNDTCGDCTFAACGNLIRSWIRNATGNVLNLDPAQVVAAYSALTGYNPADPSTDQGAVLSDVLQWWMQNPLCGHNLAAFVAVSPSNLPLFRTGANLFGGLILGLDLPLTAEQQIDAGLQWDSLWWAPSGTAEAGSWGGHAVPLLAYDSAGCIVGTWARQQRLTWSFLYRYCDEAYACLSHEWMTSAGKSPSGFDYEQLAADLAAVAA